MGRERGVVFLFWKNVPNVVLIISTSILKTQTYQMQNTKTLLGMKSDFLFFEIKKKEMQYITNTKLNK